MTARSSSALAADEDALRRDNGEAAIEQLAGNSTMASRPEEYVRGTIWIRRYPVRYAWTSFDARMTVIRLHDGSLMLHSPCAIDGDMKDALAVIGSTAYIVAPGTYHHVHVRSAQAAFPAAQNFICPGVELKCPSLKSDRRLGDTAPDGWRGQLDQVVVRGSRWISEVAFFHRDTRTLILVDLIENFTDRSSDGDWVLKFWFKYIFKMWGRPKPAPEYQLGWFDKAAARRALLDILQWDFERVIMAHGDLIENDAKERLREAWIHPLRDVTADRVRS